MGAFYQTSSPQFIDFMYKPPMELMMKSIEAADQQNEAQDAQVALLEDTMAKIKTLEGDSPRTREIIAAYQERVNQISSDINAAPEKWQRRMADIKGLARQVSTDFTSGELAAQQANYSSMMERMKEERERVNKKLVSPEFYEAWKRRAMDPEFRTAYDAKTGDYNRMNLPMLAERIDLNDRYDKYLKDVKASASKQENVKGKDMYFINTKKGMEWVDENELRAIADQKFLADTEVQNYIRQGVELGVFKDPEALLLAAREGAVNTYGYSKRESGVDIKENTVATKVAGWKREDQKEAREDAEKVAAAKAALEKEAREAQEKERQAAMKHNQTPGMTPVPVPASPYRGWSTGGGQTYQETEYTPPTVEGEEGTWKITGGDGSGASIVPGIPGTINSSGQLAGMGKPSTETTVPINMFTPYELQPDVLRSETLPGLYANQVQYTKDYADAASRGDAKAMKDANSKLINTKSAIYTAEGILRHATDRYYNSQNFARWPEPVRQQVSGYLTYLKTSNQADSPQNRQAYAQSQMDMAYSTGLMRGLENTAQFFGHENTPQRDLFDRAVDDAVGFLGEHAEKDARHNIYDAKGVRADTSDPTIAGILNTSMLGNISIYGPYANAGLTLGGKSRELAGYDFDIGNTPFTNQGKFDFAKLKSATGVDNVTDLLDDAIFLGSTEGTIRVQVKLKERAPDGGIIGNGNMSKYMIPGLDENNTMIVEISDPEEVRRISERLAKDKTSGVANVAYIISNPDNANFRERISNVVAPNEPGWGPVLHTYYGDVGYKIQSNHEGRMEAKVQFEDNGKSYEATFRNATQTGMEQELINFHNSIHNTNPVSKDSKVDYRTNFISILKANGIVKER